MYENIIKIYSLSNVSGGSVGMGKLLNFLFISLKKYCAVLHFLNTFLRNSFLNFELSLQVFNKSL